MKHMIKTLLQPLWRISAPIRRPLIRKFDHHMMQLLGNLPRPSEPPANLDLMLNSVVRELARLQIQVELLQQHIDDQQSIDQNAARPESRLSVVAEIG
jgi:hypothetical protein